MKYHSINELTRIAEDLLLSGEEFDYDERNRLEKLDFDYEYVDRYLVAHYAN
jgi:hypothetical protein